MRMATTPMSAGGTSTLKNSRGQDQLKWPPEVWKNADSAVTAEMTRSRQCAKFIPTVSVAKNVKTVPADIVIIPTAPTVAGTSFDPGLSSTETVTRMVQDYSVEFYLSPAQHDDEGGEEAAMRQGQGASTWISLATKAANILSVAEELIIANGQNAQNHPLFTSPSLVQYRDKDLFTDLDLGLLHIQPGAGGGTITLPGTQVIQVHPVQDAAGEKGRYAENTLGAIAAAVSRLAANGYFENYAALLHTAAWIDLHTALRTTLITTAEPVEHLVKLGVLQGVVPPFLTPANKGQYGLPIAISDGTPIEGDVLYTGVVMSLSANSMDLVRGRLDMDSDGNELHAAISFLSKDAAENYRFRLSQRLAFRMKDDGAAIALLFLAT
jgi:hypothetical protein